MDSPAATSLVLGTGNTTSLGSLPGEPDLNQTHPGQGTHSLGDGHVEGAGLSPSWQPRTRCSSPGCPPGRAGRASGSMGEGEAVPGRDSLVQALECCSWAGNPAPRPLQSCVKPSSFTWDATQEKDRAGTPRSPPAPGQSPALGCSPQSQPRAGQGSGGAGCCVLTCSVALERWEVLAAHPRDPEAAIPQFPPAPN